MNPNASTSNKQKRKNKNFMMVKHKLQKKNGKRSFKDKQVNDKHVLTGKCTNMYWQVNDKDYRLVWFRFMVFNATFNNISVISWQTVLLVEKTGVSGENLCNKIILYTWFIVLWRNSLQYFKVMTSL